MSPPPAYGPAFSWLELALHTIDLTCQIRHSRTDQCWYFTIIITNVRNRLQIIATNSVLPSIHKACQHSVHNKGVSKCFDVATNHAHLPCLAFCLGRTLYKRFTTHSPVGWSSHFPESCQLKGVYDSENLTARREGGMEGGQKKRCMIASSNCFLVHCLLKVPSCGCRIEEGELELLVRTNDEHLNRVCIQESNKKSQARVYMCVLVLW